MKFFALLSALSAVCSFTSAHPQQDFSSPLVGRQNSQLVFTTQNSGTVQPRLEIRQLAANANQWALFVLALRAWQSEAQTNPSSYFGVAKIHGVPRQNYNNVGQCSNCGNADGYCTHNSVLFPAWHRVYVALWEQQFLARAAQIANQYTGSQQAVMQQAAQQLRWPYWDWAARPPANTPNLPYVVGQSTVTVNGPTGQVTVGNPLYAYNYTNPGGMRYYPYTQYTHSLRYPTSNNANAGSQSSRVNSAFQSARVSLRDQVYGLLTQCSDFVPFSNDNADNSFSNCANSLEGIHNTVHVTAGGSGSNSVAAGHMSVTPCASFDPIFWLHHANVDRIFAMWQAINPGKYQGSQQASDGTWTIAPGDTSNENSDLTPFYKDFVNGFWKPSQVQSWNTTFAYTYPEFSNSRGDRAAIISAARRLYGPSATATAGSSKRDAAPEPVAQPEPTAAVKAFEDVEELETRDTQSYHYVANIQAPRYYLKGSYQIYIFNGKPASEDPSSWSTDANMVGPMGVLSHVGEKPGMKDLIISGSVPLTTTLNAAVSAGLLADLSVKTASAYLKKNLQWRIVGPNGEGVSPSALPGFVVSVVCATVKESSDFTVLPVYGTFSVLVDVTTGLLGGLDKTTKLVGNALGNIVEGLLG